VNQVVEHGVLVVQRVVRQAHRPEPALQQSPVTQSIGDEGGASTVGGEPVELHDQARSRPHEVGLVALDPDAGLRLLDRMPLQESKEAELQGRARPMPAAQRGLHQLGAAPARVVLNDSIDGSRVELVCVLRLRNCPLQCLSFKDIGEVQQRAGHGRDGNPKTRGAADVRTEGVTRGGPI